MKHLLKKTLLVTITILGASAGSAKANHQTAAMQMLGATSAPVGFVQFCKQNPRECQGRDNSPARTRLTNENWRQLVAVNRHVNQTVYPVTDQELYGTAELWTYPNGRGDCEDYVLLKRRILIEQGWPASNLLMTVVRDEEGNGHAVLTVVTDRGDFILDNKVGRISRWDETPYEYIKRQSEYDVAIWASIADDRTSTVGSVARR